MPDTPRDPPALDRMFDRVYDELRRLAHWQRSPLDGATLDTTALVHELYLQMSRGDAEFGHTRQFYAYAGRAMRHLLAESHTERYDDESGMLHAAHVAWNALARLEILLRRDATL